jgi:hypothetical protein
MAESHERRLKVPRFRIVARREVVTEDEVAVDVEAASDVPTFGPTNEWDTSGDWYVYDVDELDEDDESCGVSAAMRENAGQAGYGGAEVIVTEPSRPRNPES